MRESILRQAYADGRAAYPGVSLTFERFRSHSDPFCSTTSATDWARHGRELFLCCASVCGDPEALLIFEREYLPAAAQAIARTDPSAPFVEAALAGLRQKLLFGSDPKLAEYSASGSLTAWTMVVATRHALQLQGAQKGGLSGQAGLAERLLREHFEGEALIIAGKQASLFQRALREAVLSLPARERNILRMHLLGRCNVDQISRAYAVQRATALRWLSSTKDLLFESVRGQIRDQDPEMSDEEFSEIARRVRSQLDLTFADCSSGSSHLSSSNR